MIRGIYTAVSSLMTLEAKQGVVTNNLTNINTPGFKPDELIVSQFDKVMLSNRDGSSNSFKQLGSMSIGSKIDSTRTKFTQGTLKQTTNSTDFALSGPGFFTVTQNGKEYYTRDGSFVIDMQGNLVTNTGASVLGVNANTGNIEPINLAGATDITVDGFNNININGNPAYRMRVFNFGDYKNLDKIADNLYSTEENGFEISTTKVQNKTLETSEVNPAVEMVNLTNTLRSFESSMKVLNYLDESLKISANEIGRV